MATPNGDAYEVRGRTLRLTYDEVSHTLAVDADGVGKEVTSATNPQAALTELGVYTRIERVGDYSNDRVVVSLKPAASVELRASEDNRSRLIKRPVSNQFDGNTITKRRGKYGYTATASMELLENLGLDHKEPAAVYSSVNDGSLAFRVEATDAPHSMITRIDSTGLLGIPNGIAAAADLDGHGVEWELTDDEEALYGKTTRTLPRLSFVGRSDGADTTISRVTQEQVEHNGKSWSQEHFKCYLRADHADAFDWTDGSYVDIGLVNVDGNLGMRLDDDVRPSYIESGDDGSTSTAPCVRKLYETENDQLNFYLPNGLVHSMGLCDERVHWLEELDALYGCETRLVFDDLVDDEFETTEE